MAVVFFSASFYLEYLAKVNIPASKIISFLLFFSGIALVLSIGIHNTWWYILLVSLCSIIPIAGIPFQAEIYSNYGNKKRGKRFVTSLLAGNLGVIFFTQMSSTFYEGAGQAHLSS